MTRFGLYAWMTFALLATPALCYAQADETDPAAGEAAAHDHDCLWHRDQLSDGWLDILDQVREKGFDSALTITSVYQQNVRGGQSTHRKAGRYSGVAELELQLDFDKLGWVPGGRTYALAAGSWSDGIDSPSVGSLFNVNSVAAGDRAIDLLELWYEQRLLEGRVRIRAGKIDMTGGTGGFGDEPSVWFDANAYANDPGMQFLNGGLVNNPQIPFPEQGLGAIMRLAPLETLVDRAFYILLGVADAQADRRTTGFTSAFARDTRVMAMAELGFTPTFNSTDAGPMPGGYRVGVWFDPQPKERFNGRGVKRNDAGLYVNADQMIFKENNDKDDSQGLGVFARYGLADGDVNPIRHFWSVGLQYQGLLPTRDDDVIGVGIANGHLSGDADFRRSRETAVELYYNIQFAPWLMLTPSIQHITHPGGGASKDALVVGARLQVVF